MLSKLSTIKENYVINEKEYIVALFPNIGLFYFIPKCMMVRYGPGPPQSPLNMKKKNKIGREKNEYLACDQKSKICSVHDRDSLEKSMPVQMRHDISFHVVHDPALFALVHREGLQRLPVIIKFCQDHCVVAGHQWAGGVAIILQHTQNN